MSINDEWLTQEEKGWSSPKKWICRHCVGGDTYLRRLVRVNYTTHTCSYCSTKRKAAPLSALMNAVLIGVKYYYNDEANAGCPYDSNFSIKYISSDEALRNVLESQGLEWSDALITDVAQSFINTGWVDAPDGDWMGSYHHERLYWSWTSFAHAVKHRSRFHFHFYRKVQHYGDDVLKVHEMLPFLGQLIKRHRMVKSLPAGTVLYRVRHGAHPPTSAELGAPPSSSTKAGRMNPAGVPYLYLAFDEITALKETRVSHDQEVTVGQWSPLRDLRIIDLSHSPPIPSIFSGKKSKYELIKFLGAFKAEISKPVPYDDSEHLEYIPTQVISEYLAQVFSTGAGKQLDGVIYASSVAERGKNLVVFPNYRETSISENEQPFAMMKLEDARTYKAILTT